MPEAIYGNDMCTASWVGCPCLFWKNTSVVFVSSILSGDPVYSINQSFTQPVSQSKQSINQNRFQWINRSNQQANNYHEPHLLKHFWVELTVVKKYLKYAVSPQCLPVCREVSVVHASFCSVTLESKSLTSCSHIRGDWRIDGYEQRLLFHFNRSSQSLSVVSVSVH